MNHLRRSFVAESTDPIIDLDIVEMFLKAVPTAIKTVNAIDPAGQKCPDVIKHWDKCNKGFYESNGPGSTGCVGEGGEQCECFTRNDHGWNYYSWYCHAKASYLAIAF